MTTADYPNRSRLFRRLSSGPHGQYASHFASRLIRDGLHQQGVWQSLNLFRDLMRWTAANKSAPADLNEHVIEAFLRFRAERQGIQPGDRAAMARLLSALRESGLVVPAEIPQPTEHEAIFQAFSDYCYAIDEGRAGGDPGAFLNHDGLSDGGGAAARGFKGMARRDEAHVRPDHHIVCDVEAAKVIKRAVLIDEDIVPDADFVPTGSIKWRDQ